MLEHPEPFPPWKRGGSGRYQYTGRYQIVEHHAVGTRLEWGLRKSPLVRVLYAEATRPFPVNAKGAPQTTKNVET